MALTQFPLYDPARFATSTHNIARFGLTKGRTYEDKNGDRWRLLKLGTALANDTTAAGQILTHLDPENFSATNDVSTGFDASFPRPAGIVHGVFGNSGTATDAASGLVNNDLWVLLFVFGVYEAAKTDGGNDIAEGDLLMPSTSADGGLDRLLVTTTTIPDPADSPVSQDALRDDLVANVLTGIRNMFKYQSLCVVGTALDDDIDATDVVKTLVRIRY